MVNRHRGEIEDRKGQGHGPNIGNARADCQPVWTSSWASGLMPRRRRHERRGRVMRVAVIGAGVAGLVTALELAKRGIAVDVFERGAALGEQACSWAAGGMLAPWCERESAEEAVITLGRQALDWWPRHYAGTLAQGTLVLAPARDASELTRFAARTSGYERLDGDDVAALEPDLAGRALYFSRSPMPFHRDGVRPGSPLGWRHIGMYAYRRDVLLRLAALKDAGELSEDEYVLAKARLLRDG